MTNYIWLNPVTIRLYPASELLQNLQLLGYQPVVCQEDHGQRVKRAYYEAVQNNPLCVVDMRCPMAAKQIHTLASDDVCYPKIHPILIESALELHRTYMDTDKTMSLTITTPCQSLADYGNQLALTNTTFLSWNDFLLQHQLDWPCHPLADSPIPPGFFNELEIPTAVLHSQSQISAFFDQQKRPAVQLIEALYCENGCHNGDGILPGRQL